MPRFELTRAGTVVRAACAADASQLLALMQALAQFEGYADRFRVTVADLLACGLDCADPQFHAWVAQQNDGALVGHAVARTTRFTMDLHPTVTLKELYVSASARGQGLGAALFQAVRDHATRLHASQLDWLVLPSNEAAKRFYVSLRGEADRDWEHWRLRL